MRYASVSEFRGRKMVSIREFYEDDGELKPGRKGQCNVLDIASSRSVTFLHMSLSGPVPPPSKTGCDGMGMFCEKKTMIG